ncbi:RNA polymerase I associated factor, A49-like protein [Metarhizium rileyi]|uniref:DNA-directed RNA polymerase I subunit rpa49 n=1 Tax=Metarhizium rileyi (strain RCEF 4871) TaxID=1649241 RepID=A0A162JNT1_METRR|nr:RNA polymerase I associated factor, A49-like protein [Metarhizium rileyi RCEF 4871]TWU72599.1 DNA-directed RNA polymerase I subunit rpa49 [Metarhizium rileyi]
MADVSNKKRKRDGGSAGKPKKKVVLDAPASSASVLSVLRPKHCPPVVATTPGIEIPENTAFYSYQPREVSRPKSTKTKHAGDKEMLLHSTSHRSLDYTAREEGNMGLNQLVKHYIGVYDPKTGSLEVVEAKRMVVRGMVRAKQASASSMGENQVKQNMMERKTDLGQTFGTKKAKKAIRENVLNAIAPQRNRDDDTVKMDEAGKAILSSVGEVTTNMATREELQAAVDEAKPVPKANLDALDIQDVYDPNVIIGADILNLVPIREWQEKVQHKEGVQTLSRFVAARVNAIAANNDAVTRLRILRYFNFVLTFYLKTTPGKQRGTRQVPPRDKLREMLSPAPEAVVENIRRKFSDAGVVRKFHIDLLMAHCCVFACIVDNFEVDTQNLRDDLRVDQKTINQYFHEIGGRVKPVSNKAEGGRATHVARLKLPLDFPKQRQIAPRRK